MNDLTDDIPSDDSKGTDLSDNSPRETFDLPVENDSGNAALDGLPKDVPDDIHEGEDIEKLDVPSGNEADDKITGDIPDGAPDDIPEGEDIKKLDVPSGSEADDKMVGDIPDGAPDDIPEGEDIEKLDVPSGSEADDKIVGDIPDGALDDIPEGEDIEKLDVPSGNEADDKIAGDVLKDIPDDIPEGENMETLDVHSRDEMDDQTTGGMPESVLDDISEDGDLETFDTLPKGGMEGSVDGDIPDNISENPFEEKSDTNDIDQPIASLSDFMNAHHYSRWDYPTYSQDPVWRNLMRNEFPGHELPELSPDSANEQLSEYMNSHKYARDDFDEYSKDPVWQELNHAAFPDLQGRDLHSAEKSDGVLEAPSAERGHDFPVPATDCLEGNEKRAGDVPRISGLDDCFLSDLPENRRNAIDMAYKDAPPEMISEINDRLDEMMPVADTGYSFDKNNQLVKDGCYYSPQDHQVRMDEMIDPDEYAEVLPHEMTHFLDHTRGWESHSPEFSNALATDVARMDRSTPEGRMLFNEMLDDAFNTGAAYDRNISDIIHGAFRNDPEIMSRYYTEGVAGSEYSHWDGYWDNPFAREEETYANCGAIMCANSRIGKNFLERYYPSTGNQFNKFYNIK